MRLLVAVTPADFRRGIDGLARVCRESLVSDPFSGAVFVFRNRRGTAIKLLAYDGQGYWLCQKRLSKGKFRSGRARSTERSASCSLTSFRCCSPAGIRSGRSRRPSGAAFRLPSPRDAAKRPARSSERSRSERASTRGARRERALCARRLRGVCRCALCAIDFRSSAQDAVHPERLLSLTGA